MTTPRNLLLGAAVLATAATALSIEGVIRATKDSDEASGLRVVLNGGERTTFSRTDGKFAFDGLAAGVYLIEIEPAALGATAARTGNGAPEAAWVYSTYKVQLSEPTAATTGDSSGSNGGASSSSASAAGVQVLEYKYPGAPKMPAKYPIEAYPVARAAFFEERPRTSVWGILKNPTVIMMLVMGFMAIGMPMLMKNMDPEALKEMQEQQAAMGGGDPMAMLSNLLGGGSGGGAGGASGGASDSAAASRTAAAAGGGGSGATVRHRPAAPGAR